MRHKAAPLPSKEPALLEQEAVDKLLVDCVQAVCEEEALKQGILSPVIESIALESLVAAVDECIPTLS